MCALAGIAAPVGLELRSESGKRLYRTEGPMLCTHFGVSGPTVLDVSRHWIAARREDPGCSLVVRWLPEAELERVRAAFKEPGRRTLGALLRPLLPARLAESLIERAALEPGALLARIPKSARRELLRLLSEDALPVHGHRGFTHAETTAGGVPLAELRKDTLEARTVSGLHLCGEVCDVDGRLGGFNFQWAWASGFVAGQAAARALAHETASDPG